MEKESEIPKKYMVWFFAGGESRDDKFNVFTGTFISFMKSILGNDFDLIKGIYFSMPVMNVIWALNHSQHPVRSSGRKGIPERALGQMIHDTLLPDTRLVMVSSSSGSVIAAQVACYLAMRNNDWLILREPFDIALGSTLISRDSEVFRTLVRFQKKGIIGKILYDELQDEGDNSTGIGGTSRRQAWSNALGIAFPLFSKKYNAPSFLNTNPETGHIHRRRSQTVQKALDFIQVMLVDNKLAGDFYCEKAIRFIARETEKSFKDGSGVILS